jgi:hypothetical protein
MDFVPHFFYSHEYINNATCLNIYYKKESDIQCMKNASVILPSAIKVSYVVISGKCVFSKIIS